MLGDERRGDRRRRGGARQEASTIVDVTGAQGRVLRRGALSLERAQRGARAARRHPDGRGMRARAPVREYVLVFLVAAAVTYLLTVVAREIALRTGAVAAGPRPRRARRADPVPRRARDARRPGRGVPRGARAAVPLDAADPFVFRDAGIVLIAGALICAVGVLDDLFELDALTKLGGQVLAAGFLIYSGIQYTFFPMPGRRPVLARPGPGCAAHRCSSWSRPSTR